MLFFPFTSYLWNWKKEYIVTYILWFGEETYNYIKYQKLWHKHFLTLCMTNTYGIYFFSLSHFIHSSDIQLYPLCWKCSRFRNFFKAKCISIGYNYCTFFLDCLTWFLTLAIVNWAAVLYDVCIWKQVILSHILFISFGYIPRSWIAVSYGFMRFVFGFLRNPKNVSIIVVPVLFLLTLY